MWVFTVFIFRAPGPAGHEGQAALGTGMLVTRQFLCDCLTTKQHSRSERLCRLPLLISVC